MRGQTLRGAAVLLEPVRVRRTGLRAARVSLRGEVAVVRVAPGVAWPGRLEVGEEVDVRGLVVPLSRAEAYQRPVARTSRSW